MEFTGERFHPDGVREIWYEHLHRYHLVSDWVDDCDVLDVACGEGYGSHLLAQRAGRVVGADVSGQAVAHARETYSQPNLEFVNLDAASLPIRNDQFDRVVSFETVEHLLAQEALVDECARVLKPDGLLFMSSPDRHEYSVARDYDNPHHLKELSRDEFFHLLADRFEHVELLGQRLQFHSTIYRPDKMGGAFRQAIVDRDTTEPSNEPIAPMYWVAICGNDRQIINRCLNGLDLHLFSDQAQSVYEHYYHEIRKNMAAGAVVAERDEEIQALKAQVEQLRAQIAQPDKKQGKKPFWQR